MDCVVSEKLLDVVNNDTDILVFAAAHSFYCSKEAIANLAELAPMIIFDTVGVLDRAAVKILERSHKISVLGRGDL